MQRFRCVGCSHVMESAKLAPSCERCGSAVVLAGQVNLQIRKGQLEGLPPGVWRYRGFLPQVDFHDLVTLGEGGTPLLRAERLGQELGLRNLMIKDESRNPTGSFMDRGSTVLLTLANLRGISECTCITTGNLGASLAAYCAKAGIRARVRIHPNTDQGKLYQMLAYGAVVEAPLSRSRLQPQGGRALAVTAGNPYLLEGEKTTGFEIVHDLGWKAPDVIVVPVGTGGHLSMIWQALVQLREAGLLRESECRLLGVQLEGAPPPERESRARMWADLRGFPVAELEGSEPFFRAEATKAMDKSGGHVLGTTSRETIAATSLLARTEGIFAEPASASVVASLEGAIRQGYLGTGETVVCVVTGAGLKDTNAVSRLAKETRRATPVGGYALPAPQIGPTKFALLRLLDRGPSYGYELRRQLSSERKISTASVYQHLTELEGYSLVRRKGSIVAKGRERVLYELTRRGVDFVKIAGRLERAERRVST